MARRNIGKPGQPPIYRAAERLLQWATPVIDSLPKSLAMQTMGGAVIRNLLDALLLIQMATCAASRDEKMQCIKALIAALNAVRTTMRIFAQRRAISLRQEASYIDLQLPLLNQAEAWLTKWAQQDDGSVVAGLQQ